MKGTKMLCLIAVVAAILPLAKVLAQTPQGRILGTVSDSTGAVVPGATVTLKNDSTGIGRTTETSGDGNYVFLYLESGTYTVTVERAGFTTGVYPGVKLEISEQRRLDARLKVGQVTTSVVVTGAEVKVQTDSSDIATIATQRQVTDMPIEGRDFSYLALEAPGTYSDMTTAGIGGPIAASIYAGGTPSAWTGYSWDGVDDFFYAWTGPATVPSLDAIQEVRVDRNLFTAENGGTGTFVQVETKQGTNKFHGTAWEFVRNYDMNAEDLITHTGDGIKRNQFGGGLGGPIIKQKAFFYFNWETQRQYVTSEQLGTVFTAKARRGDLSDYGVPVIDPQTGQPFPGEVIPTNRLDPTWQAYMNALMPLPSPSLPGLENNAERLVSFYDNWTQPMVRLDYHVSQKDNLYFRGSMNPRSTLLGGPSGLEGPNLIATSTFWNEGLGWTRSWTPNVVSDLSIGDHHERQNTLNDPHTNFQPPQADRITGVVTPPVDYPIEDYITTAAGFTLGTVYYPMAFDQRNLVYSGKVTWIKGNHLIKVGFTGQDGRFFQDQYNQYMNMTYFGAGYTGSPQGDALLGIPESSIDRGAWPRADNRLPAWAGYVQDDWKTKPSLTLNLGLRYDLFGMPYEAHNIWGSMDFTKPVPPVVVAGDHVDTSVFIPSQLTSWLSEIETANQTNLPTRTLAFGDHRDFGPRIGFAWRPFKDNNKTVVRGGYGIFYAPREGLPVNAGIFTAPYYQQIYSYNSFPVPTPGETMGTPYVTITVPPPSAYIEEAHYRSAYMQQANITFERELPRGIVAQITIVDQNSKKMPTQWNLNNPVPGPGPMTSREPWPTIGTAWAFEDEGHSRYDDLELSLRKTGTHYSFWWNHTYAKLMGRGTDQYGSDTGDIVNPSDRDQFYGPIRYLPQNDKLSYVIDLPSGRGRKFFNRGGAEDVVLGGWTASGFFTLWQQPAPLTITWSGDTADIGIDTVRPNRVCNGNLSHVTAAQFFNQSCFVAPTPGTVGNSATGAINVPGSFMPAGDFALFKSFHLGEAVKLQLRGEAYSVFNHPYLGTPGTVANSTYFGVAQYPNYTNRTMQIAVKLMF